MDMRDLLVLVEGEATAAAPYALSMGLHLEAHLTAVAFVQQRLSVGPFAELPHNLLEAMYEESCRAAERAEESRAVVLRRSRRVYRLATRKD